MRHIGQVFNDDAVEVDGKQFERCTFNRCRIIFSGMDATEFHGCVFNECHWVFAGGAEKTLQYLAALYAGLDPGGRDLIEAIFDSIRSGGVGHSALVDLPEPAISR